MKSSLQSFYYLSIAVIIFTLGLTIFSAYQRIEPFKAPIIKTDPMRVLTKTVKPGETLTYEIDYCVYQTVPTTNSRRIIQLSSPGRIYFLATTESAGSKPLCNKVQVSFPLPNDLEAGKYKVVSTATYRVNSVNTVTKDFETESFEIIK